MARDHPFCFFGILINRKWGPNRRVENVIFLCECTHDISNHVRGCHLSHENITQVNLILMWPELLDLRMSKVKGMTICPTHRNNLGQVQYRHQPWTCQYPEHVRQLKKVAGGTGIIFKTSRAIYTLFGEMVQVGSRESQYFMTSSIQILFLAKQFNVFD